MLLRLKRFHGRNAAFQIGDLIWQRLMRHRSDRKADDDIGRRIYHRPVQPSGRPRTRV